jgi:hypothetical protein
MAAGATYESIATTTLSSTAQNYTFSSIPQTYTDLRLIVTGANSVGSGNDVTSLRFNGVTSTLYSYSQLIGNGTIADVGNGTTSQFIALGRLGISPNIGHIIIDVLNYTNTSTNKSLLCRWNVPATYVGVTVGLYRNTSAITSITIDANQFAGTTTFLAGTSFTLYGIKAA